MGNFQLPKSTLLDTDGVTDAGTVEFYEAGTSTPLTVYSDSALSVSLGTSITADGSGRFSQVWIDEDQSYKVIVKDSGGSTLYTVDNLKPYATSGSTGGSSSTVYINKIASHPLSYGAIGDGVADESTAVQSAITNATGTIDLLGLTYKCDSGLTIGAGKRLINGVLDFSACTDEDLVTVTDGTLGSTLALTANCDVGDTSVEISTGDAATLAAGNWVLLTSTANWDDTSDAGEICKVKSVSGTTVTLAKQVIGAYTTANTAQLKEITTTRNVTFNGVKIIAADTGTQYCIHGTYAEELLVNDCVFEGFKTAGVFLQTCINSTVTSSKFLSAQSTSDGVSVQDGSLNTTISACSFVDVEVGVFGGGTSNGVVRQLRVKDCSMEYCLTGVSMDALTSNCEASGNIIRCTEAATSDGILMEGLGSVITGNTIKHSQRYAIAIIPDVAADYSTPADGSPVSIQAGGSAIVCTGNAIDLCGGHGIYISNNVGAADLHGITVDGNSVNGLDSQYAIRLQATNCSVFGFSVNGNTITNCVDGIVVDADSGETMKHGTVSGNSIYTSVTTGNAISITSTDAGGTANVVISGNAIDGCAKGVNCDMLANIAIKDNSISTSNTHNIFIDRSNDVSVSGNTVDSSSGDGIRIESSVAANDWHVSGNFVTGFATEGIVCQNDTGTTTAVDRISVIGNHVTKSSAGASEAAIHVVGVDDIDQVLVSGNNVYINDSGQDGQPGIYLETTNSACTISNFAIIGNLVREERTDGLGVQGVILLSGVASSNFKYGFIANNYCLGANEGITAGASPTYTEVIATSNFTSNTTPPSGSFTYAGTIAIGSATDHVPTVTS